MLFAPVLTHTLHMLQGFPAGPFTSRRDIALTALGGSAALWLVNHSECS